MKSGKACLQNSIRWRPLVVLGIAVLATMAASPGSITVIGRLQSVTNVIYADGGPGGQFFSTDQGATWNPCLANECYVNWSPQPAIVVCDYEARNTCYRATDGPEVQVSLDAGNTWSTSWQVPPARRSLMQRLEAPDVPRDLVISGGARRFLLVAMGRDGILRKELPDGAWQQIGIADAEPKPLWADSVTQAIGTVPGELALWMGLALVTLLATGTWVWHRCAPGEVGPGALFQWGARSVLATVALIVFAVGLYVVTLGLLVALALILTPAPARLLDLLMTPAALAALLYAATYVGFVRQLRGWTKRVIADPTRRLRITRAALLMTVGIMVIGALPWIMWARGEIWAYTSALLAAVGLTILIAAIGFSWIAKGIRDPVG